MASQVLWTSDLCSIMERRSDRTRQILVDLTCRGARIDQSGAKFEGRRRRWARVVRGLERRVARAIEQESSWPD